MFADEKCAFCDVSKPIVINEHVCGILKKKDFVHKKMCTVNSFSEPELFGFLNCFQGRA